MKPKQQSVSESQVTLVPMIHTQDKTVERNLGREALDAFQDAISPNWLLKVVLGTSVVFIALVVVAYTI